MGSLILITFAALVCAACQADDSFVASETTIASRGVEVPATFVHPAARGSDAVPLVVMAHGHGGTREEAGGFTRVAAALAERGIASIRVDFPGCGDSKESFTANTLSNMLADIRAARDYAVRQPGIDPQRVGILGYSMGGRLALLATAEQDYDAVALWAPVALDGIGPMLDFLGGQQAYEELRAVAAADGQVVFETQWGDRQHLGLAWFTDMEQTTPLAAIGEYRGALLVLHGSADDAVRPENGRAVVASAVHADPLREEIVEGADHGLGFYDGDDETATAVVNTTADFLAENL